MLVQAQAEVQQLRAQVAAHPAIGIISEIKKSQEQESLALAKHITQQPAEPPSPEHIKEQIRSELSRLAPSVIVK